MNDAIAHTNPKTVRISFESDGWQIQVKQNLPISFKGITVNFGVDEERHTFEVASKRIAELILSEFGKSDIIIFGDQIERRSIDPETGEVNQFEQGRWQERWISATDEELLE